MITFQREILTRDLIHEMLPLLEAHWKEVAHYEDIPLDVDVETYLASESAGIVRCFTVRDNARVSPYSIPLDERIGKSMLDCCRNGLLVGYAVFFVRPNPHYKGSIQAAQDVLYMDPSHRGKPAYKFIRWCDEQLQAEGVQAVYQHVKASKDFGRLLESQGYELVDIIYAKRLDDVKEDVGTSSYIQYAFPKKATWRGEAVKVIGERDGRAVIIVEGYEASNTVPIDQIVWPDAPEMGQDWKDQAQYDYDTARFMGHPK